MRVSSYVIQRPFMLWYCLPYHAPRCCVARGFCVAQSYIAIVMPTNFVCAMYLPCIYNVKQSVLILDMFSWHVQKLNTDAFSMPRPAILSAAYLVPAIMSAIVHTILPICQCDILSLCAMLSRCDKKARCNRLCHIGAGGDTPTLPTPCCLY